MTLKHRIDLMMEQFERNPYKLSQDQDWYDEFWLATQKLSRNPRYAKQKKMMIDV